LYKKEVKKKMEEEMPLKKEKDMVRIHAGAEGKRKIKAIKRKEGRYINNPLGGEKEKMKNKKSGKKTIGIAIVATVIASILVVFPSVPVMSSPDPTENIVYLVPDNSSVPGYPDCVNIVIYTDINETDSAIASSFDITYDPSCIKDFPTFDSTGSGWLVGSGAGITYSNPASGLCRFTTTVGPNPPVNGSVKVGTLNVCCNDTGGCCGCFLNITNAKYTKPNMATIVPAIDNGTFICGKLLVINKTVKDPNTGNWVDGPLTLGPNWLNKNISFNITVTAACENLSNVVVNDTMDPSLKYKNASDTPDSSTDQTVNWTIGQLSAGSSKTILFNATIIAYGTDDNTAKTSGTVDKIGGVGVDATDSVTITTKPPALIDVEKTVWSKPKGAPDYNSGTWINAVQGAKIGEIYRFKCTIHNSGSYDLTNITFNDTLSNSLVYANNATMVTPDGIKRDIVMSGDGTDYEVNSFLQDPLTLKPCQRIFIEFDAKVVNYGNVSNVQWAKGKEPGGMWIYDHDDAWIDTPKPDLNVTEITINYEATKPQVKNNAIGPLPPGMKTQCNNISAVVEEDNNVTVAFPFKVKFEVNGTELNCSPVQIPAGFPGKGKRTVYCNCSFYPIAGVKYNISVTVDSDDGIIESDETNNTKWRNVTAKWLGLKGDGWQDGRNITKLQCHDQGTINITYSAGDSKYLSGHYHPDWTTYTVNWTASDLSIPPTGTCIKKARLYVYYSWDKTPGRNISDYFTMKFNGYEVPKDEVYTDARQVGDSYNYGMVAYNVTGVFSIGGNTANLTNSYPGGGNASMEGMFLVVVYNHPDEPERIIMMNEGLDWIDADDRYCVDTEEATTYAPFTCPAIPLNKIGKATLATVTVDAGSYGKPKDPHWQALYFNDELLAKGNQTWPVKYCIPTVNEADVLPYLKATNNTAAIQSYKPAEEIPGATHGDSFEASLAFLILEKSPREIKTEDKLVQPQEEFTVNVTVDTHGLDIYGVQYKLYYNNSVLRAEMQNKGPFLGETGTTSIIKNEIHHTEGYVEYAESMKGTGCTVGNGTLATIEFIAIGERGAESALEFRDVKFYDCNGNEVNNSISSNGRVKINENHLPVPVPGSMHTINNVAKKYPCVTTLCACKSYDPDAPGKGGNISYVRWAFGDGQYGTSEGLENCQKEHEYTSYQWTPIGDPDGDYVPMDVMLTLTDDGCPPLTNSSSIPVNVYIAGDANGDGEVDIGDAVWIGLHWEETCNADNEYCGCTNCAWATDMQDGADLNNDCEIDIGDAVLVGANWEHTAW